MICIYILLLLKQGHASLRVEGSQLCKKTPICSVRTAVHNCAAALRRLSRTGGFFYRTETEELGVYYRAPPLSWALHRYYYLQIPSAALTQ